MASEPRMPRGRSLAGFFVSSAAVATMSKPMKAKNTTAAPAMTPPQPNVPWLKPNNVWTRGASQPVAPASAGCAGGTKGL